MLFNYIDENNYKTICNILSKSEYYGSAYSYAYWNVWSQYINFDTLKFHEDELGIYIMFKANFEQFDIVFLPPIAKNDANICDMYAKISNFCVNYNIPMDIHFVPKKHIELLSHSTYKIERHSDYDEYLYLPSDLIQLQGKKYHAKRNHLSKFAQENSYEFLPYTEELYQDIIDFTLSLIEDNSEDLLLEIEAIKKFLTNLEKWGLFCDYLTSSGKIVAYSIGEITPTNCGIVHIEKAYKNLNGAYAMINNLFAKKYFSNCKYINRQEDMGVEGLKRAKLSYYPSLMSEYYSVRAY